MERKKNKIVIFFILLALGACKNNFDKDLEGYRIVSIQSVNKALEIEEELSDQIIKNISNSKRIKGPVKGVRYQINLVGNGDTIIVSSFGGAKYFSYDSFYYQADMDLFSDSLKRGSVTEMWFSNF